MSGKDNVPLMEMMPAALDGWNVDKTIPLLSHSDLYEYMDGGAELYISYNVKEALSRSYKKENQPEVIAEIYDLSESRNAFGVFSHSRESENLQLGQGAFTMPGVVLFWKDHYYVSLSSWESTPEATSFILELGNYIQNKIPETGIIPGIMSLLPEQGLVPYGYIFFHHHVWLNAYYFISHDDILNIDDSTNAVLARYGSNESRQYLLVIQYINNEEAAKAFTSFGQVFFPEGLTDNSIMLEDRKWLSTALQNNLIVAVFNGDTRHSAHQLLTNVLDRYKKTT